MGVPAEMQRPCRTARGSCALLSLIVFSNLAAPSLANNQPLDHREQHNASTSEAETPITYGPGKCISMWRNQQGHCSVRKRCKVLGIASPPVSLICRNPISNVRHVFDYDLPEDEDVDTKIPCKTCEQEGEEDEHKYKALTGISKSLDHLISGMSKTSNEIHQLNEKVFNVAPPESGTQQATATKPFVPKMLLHHSSSRQNIHRIQVHRRATAAPSQPVSMADEMQASEGKEEKWPAREPHRFNMKLPNVDEAQDEPIEGAPVAEGVRFAASKIGEFANTLADGVAAAAASAEKTKPAHLLRGFSGKGEKTHRSPEMPSLSMANEISSSDEAAALIQEHRHSRRIAGHQ